MIKAKELTEDKIKRLLTTKAGLEPLYNRVSNLTRGDEIEAATLWGICGGKELFRKVWGDCRDIILYRTGVVVDYVHSRKAYRWLTVQEELGYRNERIQKGIERKSAVTAAQYAMIADGDFENDHQRQLRNLLMNQHLDIRGKINSQREHARIAWERPETLPRPLVQGNGAK